MYGEYNLSTYDYVLFMLVVSIPVVVLLVVAYKAAKKEEEGYPPMTKAQYDAWVLSTYPESNNASPMYKHWEWDANAKAAEGYVCALCGVVKEECKCDVGIIPIVPGCKPKK